MWIWRGGSRWTLSENCMCHVIRCTGYTVHVDKTGNNKNSIPKCSVEAAQNESEKKRIKTTTTKVTNCNRDDTNKLHIEWSKSYYIKWQRQMDSMRILRWAYICNKKHWIFIIREWYVNWICLVSFFNGKWSESRLKSHYAPKKSRLANYTINFYKGCLTIFLLLDDFPLSSGRCCCISYLILMYTDYLPDNFLYFHHQHVKIWFAASVKHWIIFSSNTLSCLIAGAVAYHLSSFLHTIFCL